jgi:hypothetical protein
VKPASRTETGGVDDHARGPGKASSRGLRRSSGPAGARPDTVAAASCGSAGARSTGFSHTVRTSLSASESRVMTRLRSQVALVPPENGVDEQAKAFVKVVGIATYARFGAPLGASAIGWWIANGALCVGED